MATSPDPIVELRRLARESYDTALRMAIHHMREAEKTDAELATIHDIVPSQAAAGRRMTHARFAEIYAQIAQAAQKVPGQQF